MVHAFQAGGGALEIAVVKSKHDRAAILGVEDAAETILEAPVILVRAFEEDRDMISAQYERVRERGEGAMQSLPMDAALLRFRQLIAKECARERAD